MYHSNITLTLTITILVAYESIDAFQHRLVHECPSHLEELLGGVEGHFCLHFFPPNNFFFVSGCKKTSMYDLCECLMTHVFRQSVTVGEILQADADATICTDTQCFAGWDDLVTMGVPASAVREAGMMFLTMALVVVAFIMNWMFSTVEKPKLRANGLSNDDNAIS
jgi:hypothetical protein